MKRTLTVLGILFGVLICLFLFALFYYLGVTRGIFLDKNKLTLETGKTSLFDANGNEIETASYAEDVAFSEFPPYLPNAFVAVEDKRFYTHHGFDLHAIARAALKNIKSFSFREGASTISQQLIKNTHLTSEKTLTRKLKEFKLTRALEKTYSKEEILELYLNSIYFGHSAFGIGDAAAFYFGKTPKSLSIAESAMLAALVRSPNRYSPFKNEEKCLARRNLVLSLMKEQGYIDESEYTEALSEPLPTAPSEKRKQNSYLSLVYDELSDLFPGAGTAYLASLRVYTAYDPALQSVLERADTGSDVSLFVRSTENNAIKAYHSTVGMVRRLPASTIKPLLVYGPAVEENFISPATAVKDERTDFSGYMPDDAGGATGEYMSVRYALSHSVNIPAVKILNSIGVDRGAGYLEKMGMKVEKEDRTLALALGGMREGFTLKELADGYATFAKEGNFAPSAAILRVEDGRGRILYRKEAREKKVFSEETSFLIGDMLSTAAREGTAKRLSSLPYFVGAKTGTAEGKAGNLDAYTIAYTSEDVVAVWLGNRDNSPVDAMGGGLPANLAKKALEALYAIRPPKDPETPEGVEKLLCDSEAYATRHELVLSDPIAPRITSFEEWFKKTACPKEQSTKYSHPSIQTPIVSVKNGCVTIELCQAEYYSYVIKRENRGEVTTIYSGEYCRDICDNSVRAGERYQYIVIPVYEGHEGEPVRLPSVQIERSSPAIPDDWWTN